MPWNAKHHVRVISTSVLVALAAGGAWADDFYLATGKVVHGAVVSQSPTEYVIRTEVGTIKIGKTEITRVVSIGTTAAEVEGDVAAAKADLKAAATFYQQALNEAAPGSDAAVRLRDKLARVQSHTQASTSVNVQAQVAQARQLVTVQQFDAAQTLLDQLAPKVAADDPLSAEVHLLQAQLHYGRGLAAKDAQKGEIARQEFQDAIAAEPNYYPAYIALGELDLKNSSTMERGIENLEKGLKIAGERMPAQQRYNTIYMLAGKYFDQKKYDKAANFYAVLIPVKDQYPAYADALDKAVESYVRMGEETMTLDTKSTINNLNVALKLNPRNEKALFLLGRIYLDVGQLENAVVTFQRLLEINPNYEEANRYLGNAYFQIKDYEKALTYLGQELDNHPNDFQALVDRAEVHIARGNYNAAQSDLNAAKAQDAKNWYSYYLSALLAYRQQDYAAARASLMEALERKQGAIPVHLLMGRVLMKQNQTEGARKWFTQVADSLKAVENLSYRYQVERASALTYLAQMAITERSPRQALNFVNDALAEVPDYPPALVANADADVLMANDPTSGRPRNELMSEAEALYLKAYEKDPNNAEFALKLARFYHTTKGDQATALKYYNLYVDKGGKDPQVNGWLVEVGGEPRSELVSTPTATMVPVVPGMAAVPVGGVMTTATATVTTTTSVGGVTSSTVSAEMTTGSVAVPGVAPIPVSGMPVAVTPATGAVVAPAVPVAPVAPAQPALAPGQTPAPAAVQSIPVVPVAPVAPAPAP